MRALAACMVALGLVALPAMAGTGGAGDKDAAAGSNAPAAAAVSANPSATVAKADSAGKAEPSSMATESELQQLRELLESQAKQLQEQQQRMQLLEEQLSAASAAREGAVSSALATPADPAIGPAGPAAAAQDKKADEPTSLHYKGVTITPGGFMAAETVWRQKALSADINSPLNANPFNGSSAAHITEWNASGRQSRFSLLTEGKLDNVKIGGYYETDFLSAGTTSNDNQSNSYTLRQRQFWGQAAFTSGWTFTGGQQWSLLTETTKGMDNRTEALPQTIDAQYHAGFSWARQFGFRVTKNFDNKVWLGFAIEEAQSTVSVHGNPTAQAAGTVVSTPTGTTTINTNPVFNNFLIGAFGAGGGLYNPLGNYAYNRAPDFIFKAVFEPGFGHYEVFGLLSSFRDRVFPCVVNSATLAGCNTSATSAFGAFNDSRVGGGAGANARWNLFAKKVDFGLHGMAGTGIGRYGSVGLPDLSVRPNGTLVPLRNYQALATLQFHPTPKLDINLNVGGEYSDRVQYVKPGGAANTEGYGAKALSNSGCWTETLPVTGPSTSSNTGVPTGVGGSTGFIPGPLGSCTGDTRNVIEGSIGFWYRFYKGPRGTVQYGMQYSNLIRNTWRGTGTPETLSASGQPHSDENMVFTSFRYYLP